MKALKYLAVVMAGLFVSVSCNGSKVKNNHITENDTVESKDGKSIPNKKYGKILIVFFSHAGENYSVGDIKVGNTKLVANKIQEVTGGDIFEIVPVKNYDMPYNQLTEVAQKEADDNEFPAFKDQVKDISNDVYVLQEIRPQRQDHHPIYHP